MRFDEVIFSGVSLSEFSLMDPEETRMSVDLFRNCVMMDTIIILASLLLLHSTRVCVFFFLLQDKYILSGLVFLCVLAIENAVAAIVSDPNTRKLFDLICFWIALTCFLFIHFVALAFVFKKVRILFSDWLLILLDV